MRSPALRVKRSTCSRTSYIQRESLFEGSPFCFKIITMSRTNRHQSRLKDFAMYIVISSAVIIFLVVCTLNGMSYQWIILWIATAFIFVSIIVASRAKWSGSFWLFLVVALTLHLLCLPTIATYLSRKPHGVGQLFAVGCFVEYVSLLIARNLILPKKRQKDLQYEGILPKY